VKTADAASAAARGAFRAAQDVGEGAVMAVRGIAGTTIRGVKIPEERQITGGGN
jgi:hypothetical protein